MTSYRRARRSFLRSVSGAAALPSLFRSIERGALGASPAPRLVVVHRPIGTIRSEWYPEGRLGSILKPFEPHQADMVVLDGLAIPVLGTQAGHEGGMVTVMTGLPITDMRNGFDCVNGGPSMDQIILARSSALGAARFTSVQLAADTRSDRNDISTRVLSYTGKDTPLYPEQRPIQAYARLLGGNDGNGLGVEQARRLRIRRQSMLDFVRRDLDRLARLVPASDRVKIDAHASAIRDLEKTFDQAQSATSGGCWSGPTPPQLPDNTDEQHGTVGRLQLAVARAVLACDLSRVLTYFWAAGSSGVSFKDLFPGMPLVHHHSLSHSGIHQPDVAKMLAAIDRFYSEGLADLIRGLGDAPDPVGGRVLDNTLVVYLTEVADGDHSWVNIPMLLFGGKNLGLAGGRHLEFPGRTTNDFWLAVARAFGVSVDGFGTRDQFTGPLSGIFA